MICPNLNDPEVKAKFDQLLSVVPEYAYYLWDKYEGEVPAKYYNLSSTQTKSGVEELFSKNPELANQVYEALGFATNNLELFKNKLISIIGTDKIKEVYQNTDVQFNSFVIDDVELGTDKDLIITIKTDKGQRTAINLRLDGDYQQLKISEGSKTVRGIYAPLSEKKTAIDFLISEFKNLGKEEVTPQQKQQALQQYSSYLDTIFPSSKVKGIVYHDGGQGKIKEEGFRKDMIGISDGGVLGDGFYFYVDRTNKYDSWRSNTESVLLNIKNLSKYFSYFLNES
jgi:hypothetical protein